MGTAIAVVWGIVLFVLGCIIAIGVLAILATLVVYIIKSIREGLRARREAREDESRNVVALSPVASGGLRSVPKPSNVTTIFRSSDPE